MQAQFASCKNSQEKGLQKRESLALSSEEIKYLEGITLLNKLIEE